MQILKLGLLTMFILLAAHAAKADAKLDKAIVSAAKKHNVPVRILRAIATVESNYGKNAVLRKNKNGTYDAGPLQINSIHWATTCKHYNVSTLQGNANCAALLLKQHQNHARTDQAWFARYHSRTPSLKFKYAKKVSKILSKDSGQYKLYVRQP